MRLEIVKKLIKEYLDDPSIDPVTYLKGRLEELDDLTSRLQKDYDSIERFEQQEEDRLCTYYLCELLEFLIKKVGERI
ncbi:MAG: hypothetical protein IJ371_02965 [Clostridia bacterium]|nr:hypothetical protein [Clostridia bacterium]